MRGKHASKETNQIAGFQKNGTCQHTGNLKEQNPDNVPEFRVLSTSEHTIRVDIILRTQDKSTPKRETTEHSKKKLPWQHLASNPIEREFHGELPPHALQSENQDRTSQALAAQPYCSCSCSWLRAVTPECGAWTRASGLCSLAKEEKPGSRARRAPSHMKRGRD